MRELCELLRAAPGVQREKEQLDEFLLQHGQRYDFSGTSALKSRGEAGESFSTVFQLLVQERFLSHANWDRLRPRDCQLRVLQCMRVLMRDTSHRALFAELGGVSKLVGLFGQLAEEHFQGQAEFGSEMLVETLSILKRFATHESADESRLQRTLVALLSTREALVLQCVLVAMYQFVQLDRHLQAIGQLGCSETLLHILMDYGPSFKVLAAELLELLLQQRSFFQDVLLHDGVSVVLSLLHSDDPNLPTPLLKALARLAADTDCAKEVRQLGGVNVVISLLSSTSPTSASLQPPAAVAVCSVLTALALDDEAALQIRKANGVYLLGQLLLRAPRRSPDDADAGAPQARGARAEGGEAEGGDAVLLGGEHGSRWKGPSTRPEESAPPPNCRLPPTAHAAPTHPHPRESPRGPLGSLSGARELGLRPR